MTIYPNTLAKSAIIGDDVLVGPNVVLESCTLKNKSFVGMVIINNKKQSFILIFYSRDQL